MRVFISDDDMCTTQKLNLARVQRWFEANGAQIVLSPVEADRILCMTCNGWALLEENSYERITDLGGRYPEKTIVMGCVVDAHPERVNALFTGPVVTTKSVQALSFEGIEALFPDFELPLSSIPAQSMFRRLEDYRDYNPNRKFVNIAEGCSFACSFCTHKPGLGGRRSRALADIMSQVEQCRQEGVEVLHLMGMETALWGTDLGSGYPELLRSILGVPGDFEIHVAQFQPHGLKLYGQELVDLLSNKRVTDIQIPIQSTSDRIMRMMNRKNHAEIIGPMLSEIRRRNTRTVLRTDVIVGWPTETSGERMASLSYAADHYDEVATYAIELSPDLPAWKFKDDAFSSEELDIILRESREFLRSRGALAHSGQQDDASMQSAEEQRKTLRDERRKLIPISPVG